MLLATPMPRQFVAKVKGKEIILPDPNPELPEAGVLVHYSFTYPELMTAKVSKPEIKDDKYVYRFETSMGTKG